jgi:hypothetical protein
MTTEERLQRIEHLTVGLAEERRKDREEYKSFWRDTQRHLPDTQRQLDQLARETRLGLRSLAEESAARHAAAAARSQTLEKSQLLARCLVTANPGSRKAVSGPPSGILKSGIGHDVPKRLGNRLFS